MNIVEINGPIDDQQRAQHLFSGDVIVYKNIQAMHDLITFTKKLLNEHLQGLEPTSAQLQLSQQVFLEATGHAQTEFRKSEAARDLFFKVLRECGVDTQQCFYDHFPLRVVPFSNLHHGAHRAAIGHHRDTWGSNINCQQNWWAPIFNLTQERTIALYPAYWDKPLANNTAYWSFTDFLAARKQVDTERQVDYPSAPTPSEPVDESAVVKLVIEPGDVLNFASAHLHASVPNSSNATRYSVEMRTVNQLDLAQGARAPNIDNAASPAMYQWFKHIQTKRSLSSVLEIK
jgi:hypothetical protein